MDAVLSISMQKLKDLWHERSTVAGLLVFAVVLNGLLCPIGSWLFSSLKNIEGFGDSKVLLVSLIAVVACILFANAILVVLWLYWRSLPKFHPHENAILFAPHYNPECAKLVHAIYERFVYELERRNPGGTVRPFFLPPNHTVKNTEEAHKILFSTGARLIVYGDIDQGTLDGQEVKGFKSISFTLKHRTLHPLEKKAVAEDIGSALAYRAFAVKGNNSFIENDVVANNLTEVALFFVALSLTLESSLDIAISILKDLYRDINDSLNLNKRAPHLNNFLRAIRRCYAVTLEAKFTKFYNSQLVGNVTDRNYDDQFRYGAELLAELRNVDPERSSFPLRQAIFNLHFGNVDQAFRNISEAKRLAAANDPAPHYSFAFLCLWRKQFKRVISEYGKVIRTDNHVFDLYSSVLDFIQSFYQRYPERPEFIFALGFMNQNFFDIGQAISDYSEFLVCTDGKDEYTPLTNYAKEQLGLILERE